MTFSVDFVRGGKTLSSKENVLGSRLSPAIRRVFEVRKGSWKQAKITSFSPRLLISTSGMSLNIREDVVVLNIELSKKHWAQFTSPNDRAQFEDLYEMVNAAILRQ